MTQDFARGWIAGKMLRRSAYPYPVVFDDFEGDKDEYIRGLRFGGYHGEVSFACTPTP